MKVKITLIIAIVAIISFAWLFMKWSAGNYVVIVNEEARHIEEELAEVEVAVASGQITVDEAVQVRARIIARLETINTAVQSSNQATLTGAQRAQLLEGLDRLKDILVKYQSTLVVVEDVVTNTPETEEIPDSQDSQAGEETITEVLEETVELVEDHVEDVVEDISEEDLPVVEDEVDSEEEDALFEENDIATSTEEEIV